MTTLLSLTEPEIRNFMDETLGCAPFRASQIRQWIYARKQDRFAEMNNIPKSLRNSLEEHFGASAYSGQIKAKTAAADSTQKLLVEFPDRHGAECVLLQDDRNHRTCCFSTQIGCAMKCAFCASGMDGFVRNLDRSEMLEQILRLNQLLPKAERLTHLVVMGTGEPLLNIESLLSVLADVTTQNGLNISERRITISTVGIPQGILQLAAANKQYKLAVSLHAPNDELRSQIVPQNRFHNIDSVLKAADAYFAATGRRVTFEYVLIDKLNDRLEHAKALAKLLQHKTAIVNLIPYNPVQELQYRAPHQTAVHQFVAELQNFGIQVKIRYRKGDTIDAACGQLRRRA